MPCRMSLTFLSVLLFWCQLGDAQLSELLKQIPLVAPAVLPENTTPLESEVFHQLTAPAIQAFSAQLQARVKDLCKNCASQQLCIACEFVWDESGAFKPGIHDQLYICGSRADVAKECGDVAPGTFCLIFPSGRNSSLNVSGELEYCTLRNTNGENTGVPCPPSFYCPGGVTITPVVCEKGHYCPKRSSMPQPCPPGSFCVIPSVALPCEENPKYNESLILKGTACEDNETGKVILPEPCPQGYYCPAGRPIPCPKESFCPVGAAKPIKCTGSDICLHEKMGMPSRWVTSLLVTFFFCAICTFIIVRGDKLFTSSSWYVELSLILGSVALGWVFETNRKSHGEMFMGHGIFLTGIILLTLYGTIVSPAMSKRFGEKSWMLFDLCSFQLLALLGGLLVRDIMVSVFLGVFWPAILISYQMLIDNSTQAYKQFVLLFVGTSFLLLLAHILQLALVDKYDSILSVIVVALMMAPASLQGVYRVLTRRPETEEAIAVMKEMRCKSIGVDERVRMRLQTFGVEPSSGSARNAEEQSVEMASVGETRSTPASEEDGAALAKAPQGVGIVLRGMHLFLPDGQTILKDVTATVPVGATVAVMGPSGCGKSSITNVLSGRAGYGVVTGQVGINGHFGDISIERLRGVMGFVPQDDVMHRALSCRENVTFQAELRMPRAERGGDPDFAKVEAQRVLETLGLAHVADTIIGDEKVRGVSGGQRKRVSIAMELVARPAVLFLDEPTSGLDSTTSHSVVETIVEVSKASGCTSLAVIHQPRFETLTLFDQLILLAAGGHLVYAGPTKRAMEYFQNQLGVAFRSQANPADVFMDAITLESATRMISRGELKLSFTLGDGNGFGLALATVWNGASAMYAPQEAEAWADLPELSPERCTWGEALLTHFRRAMLQSNLAWRMQIVIGLVIVFGVAAICTAVKVEDGKFITIIIQPAVALFLLALTQGVASQRAFGGPERVVAWREASVEVNMILYFAGRDLASLIDILLMTAFFTGTYWTFCPLLISLHNMFWSVFAFIYATWGLNYVFSILCDPSVANMMSVVATFMCYLFVGLEPSFKIIVNIGQGRIGAPLMALSPMRWILSFWVYEELQTGDSTLSNPLINTMFRDWMSDRGMPSIGSSETDKVDTVPVGRLWLEKPPISYVNGAKQLYLLGLLFRLLALVCLLFISKVHASGGGSAVATAAGTEFGKRLGKSVLQQLTSSAFYAFLFVVVHFELALIMSTT